ncbi:hypothetical protein [Sphingomonas sp. GB1N7]|uniref:hypothetical protein n=1 Tax=Parasphingomonas caseinilytica TaxID=3096158 RepID=UPI002FCB629A
MLIFTYFFWFLAGAFLANAIPHLVSGLTGRPFQTPFAKPPGIGLSRSTTNVLWAFANLAAGWALLFHIGQFNASSLSNVGAAGLGALAISLYLASHFGKLHGGDLAAIDR